MEEPAGDTKPSAFRNMCFSKPPHFGNCGAAPANFSCLLFVFLNIVKRTFSYFLWLYSKKLTLTVKYYYEKNSLVETTLKYCLLLRFSMRKTKNFFKKWHIEAVTRSYYMKKMFMSLKSLKKSTEPESSLNKVSGYRLATLFKRRLRRKCLSC